MSSPGMKTYGTIEETNPAPDEESRRKRIHVAWKAVGICAVVALASIGTIAMKDGNMGALETLVSQKHKKKHHSHSRKHRSSQEPMHTPGPTSVAVNPPTPNPPDSFLIPTPPPTTTTPAPTSVAESHHRSMPHHNTSSNDDHNTIPTQDDDAAGRNVSGFNISSVFKPSDTEATDLTRRLFESLHQVSESDAFLFGHQNTAEKGQDFRDPNAEHHMSDINIATNFTEWSAVYGFNMWEALNGTDLTHFVASAFKKGAVIEFEWEANNPITGGSANDCTGHPMDKIVPGGSAHGNWTAYLDEIAEEIKKYRVDDIDVPILLRLFHENTGSWYWWGRTCSNSTDYVAGFRYTIKYLREDKDLHNILIVYAPSKPYQYQNIAFKSRYPGNDYVDIVGFDQYMSPTASARFIREDAEVSVAFAKENNKIPALAETGFRKGTELIGHDFFHNDAAWWTDNFLKPIVASNASRIAYSLTWTNYADDCFWIPLMGDYTYDGFVHMAKSPNLMWLEDDRWSGMPYAESIQIARKGKEWSRKLAEEAGQDLEVPRRYDDDAHMLGNVHEHGYWRCDYYDDDLW